MADSVYEVMVKIGSDTEKFGQNIDKLESKVNKFGSGMKKLAGLVGGAFAVVKIKDAIVDLTQATMAQEKAEKRLETLAKNVPGTTDAQIESLKKLASAQQNLTTIGDEVTIAGQSQLATFQLSADTIAKLTPAFQDLAVGTYGANVSQEQMIQSGNLLGKVMQGQVGALSRVGVSFTEAQAEILKTGSESEKAAALIEVLGSNFGGLAQSMRNTREGQIIAMQNAWGDMKEVLGSYILPILGKLAEWFSAKIPAIQATLEKLFNIISSVSKPIIESVLPKLKNAFDNVNAGIRPIVEKVMPIFKSAFDSISKTVMPAFIKIFDSISKNVLPNYQKGFDAFVKVVFPIFKDAIKFITEKLFPPFVKIFEFIYTKIVPAFAEVFAESAPKIGKMMQTMWEVIKIVLDRVVKNFEIAWPIISKTIEIAVNIIKPLINGIVDVLWGLTDFIYGVFTGQWGRAWEGVKKIFTGIWNALTGALKAIASGIIDILWGITDFVFTKFMQQWERAWNGVKNIFDGVWSGIKGGMKSVINSIIDGVNVMIRGLNKLDFKIPDWVPALGGKGFDLSIPQIPNFEGGVKDFPGGLARINEKGGEIVNLPNGSNVIPHDISMQIAKAIGSVSSGKDQTINVNLVLDGKILTTVTSKIQAQANLGKYRALGVVAT